MNAQPVLVSCVLRLGRRLWWRRIGGGLCRWTLESGGVLLLACLADNGLHLPGPVRLPLALLAGGWMVARAWQEFLLPVFRRPDPQHAAVEIERRCGMRDNLLINAVQLATVSGVSPLAGLVVDGGTRRVRTLGPDALRITEGCRRATFALLVLLLVWGLYAVFWSDHAGNAWVRLTRPLADRPPIGPLVLEVSPSGRVMLPLGESLTVRVRLRERRGGGIPVDVPVPTLRRLRAGSRVSGVHDGIAMPMVRDEAGDRAVFSATLRDVRESFDFRVQTGTRVSPRTAVRVRPPARLIASGYEIRLPEYLGGTVVRRPGPPGPLSAPGGSVARIDLRLDRDTRELEWVRDGDALAFESVHGAWTHAHVLERSGLYRIDAWDAQLARRVTVATGTVFVEPDHPPAVALRGDRNRQAWPGTDLEFEVQASDDHGLQALWIEARSVAGDGEVLTLHSWRYPGPPGRTGDVRERWVLSVDAGRFRPGDTLAIEALAADFNPAAASPARSAPVLLRILDPQARSSSPQGGAAGGGDDALDRAIAAQRRALHHTRNLRAHRVEDGVAERLPGHAEAMQRPQHAARTHALEALDSLRETARAADVERLNTLAQLEMPWILAEIAALPGTAAPALERRLDTIETRQNDVLNGLIALLGRVRAAQAARAAAAPALSAPPPAVTAADAARALREPLEAFRSDQRRILEMTRTLAARRPDDLTEAEEEILGRMAREEAEWAAILRDLVDDFSKLAVQDFADGSLSAALEDIYQDVQQAAAELYARNIELAVPLEQGGLENAERLMHNLERWLSDKPDHLRWLMEEPPSMPPAPLAELPALLEDLVGELLDREEAMTPDIEDVTSSWIDSLDKGAGWDVADGPISSMSARGATGNLLPNQHEIGGRSGEGRSGRSHGQMVQSAAEGKGGRDTPSRLTPSPFESGSVDDRAESGAGGGTGGGKLSGFAGAGLRGPAPMPRIDVRQRLAGRQTEIRQDAERLLPHLRAYRVPSGDLETAIAAMQRVETAAFGGRFAELRQAFDASLDAMRSTRAVLSREARLRRERPAALRAREEQLWQSLWENIPEGYEAMASAYFLQLAAP